MIEERDVVILQSGNKATVEKIDKVIHNEAIKVYNFEVEDFHTYFVSDASVLTHNRKGSCRAGSKKMKNHIIKNRNILKRLEVKK